MAQIVETVRTIHLDHDQMLVLEDQRTRCVRVLHGGVWLTEPGQGQDHFLQPGQGLPLRREGALLQAQGPTQLELTHRGRGPQVAWWARLRGLASRWHLGPVPETCA
ncbi:MAG: DUF2917 domain-containing protein [Rhodoferax sp.]|nr:DUF2917 domain-containing protein [Rhodoferax sp.]